MINVIVFIVAMESRGVCSFDEESASIVRGPMWFQTFWEPCVKCCDRKRSGPKGDGGKWICTDNVTGPLSVLSVGSNNDFGFELSILRSYPDSVIHAYDHTSFPSSNARIQFHKQEMTRTLLRSLVRASDNPIDILKVDCEGCELSLFAGRHILRELCLMNTQILLEVHWAQLGQHGVSRLWKLFVEAGFGPFHKEPNIAHGDGSCVEYAFRPIPERNCR